MDFCVYKRLGSVIVSDHNVKFAGDFQNLVGQCLTTDGYFQQCVPHWFSSLLSCGTHCSCTVQLWISKILLQSSQGISARSVSYTHLTLPTKLEV